MKMRRFTRRGPCPVCGGSEEDPRGDGRRCYGYLSGDGEYAHCTRTEHAGTLPMNESSQTYAHRLEGDCRCGVRHDPRHSRNGHQADERRIIATYDYLDDAGTLLFQAVRFEPKGFAQRRPDGRGGWRWSLDGTRRVLYRLPELLAADPAATVFVVEGEKDADRLASLGLVATTNSGGAGKWRPEYVGALRGRSVVILPDADEPGRRHAVQVAASLAGIAGSVKVLELPGLPEKGDVSDWLAAGGTRAELERLAAEAPEWQPAATVAATDDERHKPTQAEVLIRLAADAGLFHTPEGDAYATIPVREHRETWALKSKTFRLWLRRQYWDKTAGVPNAQAVQDALGVLEGNALFDAAAQSVYTRIAEHDGAIYVDLGNDGWDAIAITAAGWRVIDNPPVKFRRSRGLAPLPTPAAGGSVDALRPFVNVGSDEDWRLVVAWLLSALRPRGPFPVLALHGPQGSAKSTVVRVLRALVDPSAVPLRSEPREVRDLMIAAAGAWVVAFDNLSHLPVWLSDAVCRLATGGGFGTRELYTDADEVTFDAQRPVVLNGIEELATRGDLLDRSLVLYLPQIAEDKRRSEAQFWREFEAVRPAILGALLDAVSGAIQRLPTTTLGSLPRLADFALWVTAAETTLGWTDGTFVTAYTQNRRTANALALDASPLTELLRNLAEGGGWTGTATELLKELSDRADEATRRLKSWPNSGRAVSNALRRLMPNLLADGVAVEFHRAPGDERRRMIVVRAIGKTCVPIVPNVPPNAETLTGVGLLSDDGRDDSRDATVVRDATAESLRPAGSPTPVRNRDGRDGRDATMHAFSAGREEFEV